jgi:hypothetical protein
MAGDDGQDRGSMFDMCTEVSPMCPVEATVLGYAPNLGSGYFFTIAFGALTIASLGLGIWKRTWTFAAALTLGLLLETLGESAPSSPMSRARARYSERNKS